MNQENLNLVKGSMSRKRQAAVKTLEPAEPTKEEIDELFVERITPERELPPMQPLFDMLDVPCPHTTYIFRCDTAKIIEQERTSVSMN